MAANITGTIQRPPVHRAPNEPVASRPARLATAANSRRSGVSSSPQSDTDIYLTRSHAIVERLRRAVAARSEP